MTPEGLNSRLTFLQQCLRPGNTLPVKGVSDDSDLNNLLEKLEVRAFGCLIEELLEISKEDNQDKNIRDSLHQLQISCLNEKINERPLFEEILKELIIF